MKLFHSEPTRWATVGGVIGLVIGAALAFAAVVAVAIIMFSFEKVAGI